MNNKGGAHEHMRKWDTEEDETINKMFAKFGTQWKKIVERLPGRSVSSVRNRWQRMEKGIKQRITALNASILILRTKEPDYVIVRPFFVGHELPVIDGLSLGDTAVLDGLQEAVDLNGTENTVQAFGVDGVDVVTNDGEELTVPSDKLRKVEMDDD